MSDRLPPVIRSMSHLLDSLRLRASLGAAQDKLGASLHFDGVTPGGELRLLKKGADGYRAIDDTLQNANISEGVTMLPTAVVERSVNTRPLLWPESQPQSIVFCASAEKSTERVACASLPLKLLLTLAGGAHAAMVGYELSSDGGAPLTHTDGWATSDSAYEATTVFWLGGLQLRITGRVGARLKETSSMAAGRHFALATLTVTLVILPLLVARRRGLLRQLALQHAIEHTRIVGDDLVRATLRNAANSAGILVWLLHEDERLELIGPWNQHAGIPEGETTLTRSLSILKDAESVRVGLLDAMRTRSPWSHVLLQELDGETITYQANCAPLVNADGRFIAMLGISSDITEALKTQSQVMRDEAYRNAQTGYLRHMAKEVSGPAMHVLAVVDLLTNQVSISDNVELKRLLGMAAGEAQRLSEVVRGSLELMNLRSRDLQDELQPMRADSLVVKAVETVAAREGSTRKQRVTVHREGDVKQHVMSYEPSLTSMLNIVLTNAHLYSPVGGLIEVRLRAEESALHIEVEDSGPGMKSEEIERLGEPFFRGISSIGVQGSGLGIATCFELANHAKSSIRFLRSPNAERGLLAIISLPWAR